MQLSQSFMVNFAPLANAFPVSLKICKPPPAAGVSLILNPLRIGACQAVCRSTYFSRPLRIGCALPSA
jgi:hypothetical protein